MLTSWSVLLAVVSVIVLLAGGVTAVVVLLVRRSDRQLGHPSPATAPEHAEAAQARLATAERHVQERSRRLGPPAP